jgi:hypothetical protein
METLEKMVRLKKKTESSRISRIQDQTTPRTHYRASQSGFYLPVHMFNIDSLPEDERIEITRIFWSDYK